MGNVLQAKTKARLACFSFKGLPNITQFTKRQTILRRSS